MKPDLANLEQDRILAFHCEVGRTQSWSFTWECGKGQVGRVLETSMATSQIDALVAGSMNFLPLASPHAPTHMYNREMTHRSYSTSQGGSPELGPLANAQTI